MTTPRTTLTPVTAPAARSLTAAEFKVLSEVPAEIEWFANLGSQATRRAYRIALVVAGANLLSFGRFQNVDGIGAGLGWFQR
jgi:hypothetical protein